VAESIEVLLCLDGNVIVGMRADANRGGDVTTMMGLMWVHISAWLESSGPLEELRVGPIAS
jgi:hypothetical protein